MTDYRPNWEALGTIDDTLDLGYMNPLLAGYPQWNGSSREILLVKRSEGNDLVCSRGVSSKEEAFEVYLETSDDAHRLNGSWQMSLIKTIGSIIPNISNFRERLSDHTYLTLQLDMDGAPDEWSVDHPDGNIGMFIGLVDANIDYDALNFLPINVKLMHPDELLHCLEFGAKGRSELSERYKAQGEATLSSLSRNSALKS